MARPSTMTPAKIARLEELRAAGKSLREAAAELGISHATVRAWEGRRARAAPTLAQDEAEAAALVDRPLPRAGDPEALLEARTRAAMVQRLLERLTPGVVDQTFPATSYVTLARYGDELARVIAELTPPAPKDPNEDPDVIDAERTLIARIERMIEAAEERRRSAGGGK